MSYGDLVFHLGWRAETRTLMIYLDHGLTVDYSLARSAFAVSMAKTVLASRDRGDVPALLSVEHAGGVLEVLPATLLEALGGEHLEDVEDDFVSLLAAAWRRTWKK